MVGKLGAEIGEGAHLYIYLFIQGLNIGAGGHAGASGWNTACTWRRTGRHRLRRAQTGVKHVTPLPGTATRTRRHTPVRAYFTVGITQQPLPYVSSPCPSPISIPVQSKELRALPALTLFIPRSTLHQFLLTPCPSRRLHTDILPSPPCPIPHLLTPCRTGRYLAPTMWEAARKRKGEPRALGLRRE